MTCQPTLTLDGDGVAKTVQGDLIVHALAGDVDVLVHGCNCLCTMGAGFALSLRSAFPEACAVDRATVRGDRTKLGTYSAVSVRTASGVPLTIVNAYTQFDWRGAGCKVDYEALRTVFRAIKAHFAGRRIAYPKIGAGLAGGDWSRIAAIIADELGGEDHTLYSLNRSSRRA